MADSHLRVGTFQYVSAWGSVEDLRILADYTLHRHFPDMEADEGRYLSLLQEVVRRQAVLIAKWQLTGFVHGVMNTDNMSLAGETLDYGPCAFLDAYDPATVFSSIDRQGRYAFGNQPHIAAWNLARFAETLLPLLHADQTQAVNLAQDAIADFTELYQYNWLAGMRAKLGIFNEEIEDEDLIQTLLGIMRKNGADYTNTFRSLTFDTAEAAALVGRPEFIQWQELWQARLGRQQEPKASSQQLMRKNNPALIPRNHRVEAALEAAEQQGDYNVMERFLEVLSKPYAHSRRQAEYASPPALSGRPYRTFCGT